MLNDMLLRHPCLGFLLPSLARSGERIKESQKEAVFRVQAEKPSWKKQERVTEEGSDGPLSLQERLAGSAPVLTPGQEATQMPQV